MLRLAKWVGLIILFTSSSQCAANISISNLSSVLALCALRSGGDRKVFFRGFFQRHRNILPQHDHCCCTETSDFQSSGHSENESTWATAKSARQKSQHDPSAFTITLRSMPKQILFWIPSPLSPSSSTSAANYIIKMLQFLFPPSPEMLITPQWQPNRPTKA